MVIHHKQMQFFLFAVLFVVHRRQQHATGLNAHHGSGRQVGDGDQGLAYQFFRLVVSVNTGEDGTVFAGAVIQSELQQFLGLGYCHTLFYLNSSEIGLAEGLKIYYFLEQGLDLYVGEVDLVIRCEESVAITGSLRTFCLAVSLLGGITVHALHCREELPDIL